MNKGGFPVQTGTPFTVSVLTGAHAGAVLELSAGQHVFGSDQVADVVLSDDGLAPQHFALLLREGGARIEALAEDIEVDGTPVTPQVATAAAFPVELDIGGVRLRVDGPAADPALLTATTQPDESWQPLARPSVTLLAAGLFVLGFGMAIYALGGLGYAREAAGLGPDRGQGAVAKPGAADAARFVAEKLAAAGLQRALTVQAEDGAVRVDGILPADKQAAWQAVQRQFDQTYGGRFVLHADLNAQSTQRPGLQPAAVWAGPQPYVMTEAGERLPEGSVLDDGWTVERILADRIILRRGAQSVALTF